MSGTPTVSVKLDNGTGTYPHDITAYVDFVAGIQFTRGRNDQFESITPSTLRLTLNNNDGRFTLGSATYGIKVDQMIQVKYTVSGVTQTKFTGYVQEWPVSFPNGLDNQADTTITAVDRQAKLQRAKFRHQVIETWDVNNDAPIWPLTESNDERSVTAATDALAIGDSLTELKGINFDPIKWSDSPGALTGPKIATFASAGNVLRGATNTPQTLTTGGGYVGATCLFRTLSTAGQILKLYNPSTGTYVRGYVSSDHIIVDYSANGTFVNQVIGNATINDGVVHELTIGVQHSAGNIVLIIGIDGGADNTASTASTAGVGQTFTHIEVGGGDHSIGYVGGTYDLAGLTGGVDGNTNDAISSRVNRYWQTYLGSATSASMDTATNLATDVFSGMGPETDLTDKTAWDCINAAVDAEGGLVFFSGSGALTVQGRYHRASQASPDLTLTVYELGTAARITGDNQKLINVANITRTLGGVVTATNSSSVANHDPWPVDKTLQIDTDQQATDAGNWLVQTQGEPANRISDINIDVLTLTAGQQQSINALEISDRLRITSMPTQSGASTYELIIEGWTETLKYDEWTFAANTSPFATESAWVMGDSTYGVLSTTTRLHY